jgi:ABC-type multidrug transport system ATPase subunit
MTTIDVRDVYKNYGKTRALEGISLRVEEGEIFGLIGPDGAGKTTLFRILTTLLTPDKGSATVLDYDVVKDFKAIRKLVGYMPGRFSLYQDLTVLENLQFFAQVFGSTIEENYYLIKDIYQQIEPFKHRRAGQLSGGMKQKLALSCALIHKPRILFLDEPTTGVDAVSRKEFWDMLHRLRKEGITILVSTPYMDEAGKCDRIALIQKGRLLAIDTPEGIVNAFEKPLWAVQTDQMHLVLQALRRHPNVASVFPFGDVLHLTPKIDLTTGELSNYLLNSGFPGVDITPAPATIEDCFMELMAE